MSRSGPRLATLKETELSPATSRRLAAVHAGGQTAPVYLQLANSEAALQLYLDMEASLSACTLATRELEGIKLTQCRSKSP